MENKVSAEEKIKYMFEVLMDLRQNRSLLDLKEKFLDRLEVNKGFIMSGVGKNFYIAEKVYKTYISMGLDCQALDCVHALHGDLGMVRGQTIFFLSKSGTTKEMIKIVETLNYLKKIGVKDFTSVGFTLNNTLTDDYKNLYDYFICPSEKYDYNKMYEFDQRNLIPSLSINIMQMILDEFGVDIFETFPDLVDGYKYNHMGGNNGKRLGTDKLISKI